MNKTIILFLFYLTCVLYVRCIDTCNPNEEYLFCGRCNETCGAQSKLNCTQDCQPSGCYCKPGFIRASNTDSICIPTNKCTICGENQQYHSCGVACPDYCGKPINQSRCTRACVSGCFCKSGFVKKAANSTECIKVDTCLERQCGKNQSYKRCGSSCIDYCGKNVTTKSDDSNCYVGCFCKPNYVRKSKNSTDCVEESSCPERKCGENEIYKKQTSSCHDYCGKDHNIICTSTYASGCVCKWGYVKKSKDSTECVRENTCVERKCGENQLFTKCATPCPDFCGRNFSRTCNATCVPGCICKAGYVRKSENSIDCVEATTCPERKCGENQIYKQGLSSCPDYCGKNPRIKCNITYISGCICKEGYVKKSNESSECVRGNTCPERQCGVNQIYTQCASTCPDFCGRRDITECKTGCSPGCFCKRGYVRQSKNSTECVEAYTCPERRCGENQIYKHRASSCPDYCGKDHNVKCNNRYASRCICKWGYVRKSENSTDCVKENTCPGRQCGVNQIYTQCSSQCPDFCGSNFSTTCNATCAPGCFCKRGYVRKSENSSDCVKATTCPERICGENQIYQRGVSTSQDYCGKNHNIISDGTITSRCICKWGYVKKSKDSTECVKENACSERQCGDNQIYRQRTSSCSDYCGKNHNIICNITYVSGCACKPGYVKKSSDSTECVETTSCPERQCQEDQIYKQRISSSPDYCGKDHNILRNATYVSGCACQTGYVKKSNDSNQCVKEDTCPERQCGNNEIYKRKISSCPDYCGKDHNVICNTAYVSGCACKGGYVKKSSNSTECVREETCPERRCGENQIYKHSASSCPDYCGKDHNVKCNNKYASRCICKWGYVRKSENSTECIKDTECTERQCAKNQIYRKQTTSCPDYCGKNRNTTCDIRIVSGCTCVRGYLRKSENSTDCIRATACAERQCGKHQIYKRWGSSCFDYCNSDPQLCNTETLVNLYRCVCKSGYVRISRDSSECVKYDDCPRRLSK